MWFNSLQTTGECDCKDRNVTGMKCDRCIDGRYGISETRIKACVGMLNLKYLTKYLACNLTLFILDSSISSKLFFLEIQ